MQGQALAFYYQDQGQWHELYGQCQGQGLIMVPRCQGQQQGQRPRTFLQELPSCQRSVSPFITYYTLSRRPLFTSSAICQRLTVIGTGDISCCRRATSFYLFWLRVSLVLITQFVCADLMLLPLKIVPSSGARQSTWNELQLASYRCLMNGYITWMYWFDNEMHW